MSDGVVKQEMPTVGEIAAQVFSIAPAELQIGNTHLGPIREMKIRRKADGIETGVALMVMIRGGRSYLAVVTQRGLGESKIGLINLEDVGRAVVKGLYGDDAPKVISP